MVAAGGGGALLELIDQTLVTPEENLALDIALLRRLDRLSEEEGRSSGEALRFWTCGRPVVVLGRSGRAEEEVDLSSCREAGVPVLRRASGGGTVVLARGCLNFSLVLRYAGRPALANVAESYAVILGRIARAIGIGLVRGGVSDLAWRGRKVSGNAQLRGRHGLVHHGTLLHAFDPALPSRFLHEPRRQPPYRARRVHADFIGNLPLSEKALVTRLSEAWDAHPSAGATARPATNTNTTASRPLAMESADSHIFTPPPATPRRALG